MSAQLLSPEERNRRALEKERRVLRFLREETYGDSANLGLLLGLQTLSGTVKALRQIAKKGLVREHKPSPSDRTLWGITQHGQAMAFDPVGEMAMEAYFEPSKIAPAFVEHTLGLQRLRILAECGGWSGWVAGDRGSKWARGERRPDALVRTPTGVLVAVEYERTFKTIRRYEAILAGYLKALKRGEAGAVVWVCPTDDAAVRLHRIITSIRTVAVGGRRFQIDPQRHHGALRFCDAAAWPQGCGLG